MAKKITKLSDLTPQVKNANKHTAYGLRLLEQSIQGDGFIDAQTAAADGEIISGSARLELAAEKFADVEPIIVHSDGSRPIVVIRDDIPNAKSTRAKRLSVASNQIASADWNPDAAVLLEWAGEDKAIKAMFNDDEWGEIVNPDEFSGTEQLDESEETIRYKNMLHILISVPVNKAIDVKEIIESVAEISGVEVSYGAN